MLFVVGWYSLSTGKSVHKKYVRSDMNNATVKESISFPFACWKLLFRTPLVLVVSKKTELKNCR